MLVRFAGTLDDGRARYDTFSLVEYTTTRYQNVRPQDHLGESRNNSTLLQVLSPQQKSVKRRVKSNLGRLRNWDCRQKCSRSVPCPPARRPQSQASERAG